jgi:hypothetical protein
VIPDPTEVRDVVLQSEYSDYINSLTFPMIQKINIVVRPDFEFMEQRLLPGEDHRLIDSTHYQQIQKENYDIYVYDLMKKDVNQGI